MIQIDSSQVKGEPGTGYEGPEGGAFRCSNCEYFDPKTSSCGQPTMLQVSQLARTKEGRVQTQPGGCCEYVDRKEKPMATLKAATRNSLPASTFGLPGSRKYPMPAQMVKKGKLSASSAAKIRAKAKRVLGK